MITEVKVKELIVDRSHDYRADREEAEEGMDGRDRQTLRLTIRVGLPFCTLTPGLQRLAFDSNVNIDLRRSFGPCSLDPEARPREALLGSEESAAGLCLFDPKP